MQEKELIRECLNGSRSAQQHLYNKYAEMMLGTCYRYTKSLADAEDILQDLLKYLPGCTNLRATASWAHG